MNKLIVGIPVKANKITEFLLYLWETHEINKKSVFIYEIKDTDELMLSFILKIIEGKRIPLKKFSKHAIKIHKRGEVLYTINALNKLIERDSGLESGNIDFKTIMVDWDKYQGNLILVKGGILSILPINRIFI